VDLRVKPMKMLPPPLTAGQSHRSDWPEDYADGENCYLCFCAKCYLPFFGNKGRVLCRTCANKKTWLQRLKVLFGRR